MDFLQHHWSVIADNPWLFVTWTTLVASFTWAVIHFLYRRRIEMYEHRIKECDAEKTSLSARVDDLQKTNGIGANPSEMARPESSASFGLNNAVVHLGGEGGRAPGAAGGGGGALGERARGGRGGDGGRITDLDGNVLPPSLLSSLLEEFPIIASSPGAGGGGASASGPAAVGGDGGGGGDMMLGAIPVTPGDQFEIQVGEGGQPGGLPGQHGAAGGDTVITHKSCDGRIMRVMRARGGAGGLSGMLPDDWQPISSVDIEDGLFQISTLFAASGVEKRDGLVFVLGGGWSKFTAPSLPFDATWPVVCMATWQKLSESHARGIQVCLLDPEGLEVSGYALELPSSAVPDRSLSWIAPLGARLDCEGDWYICVKSGGLILSEVCVSVALPPEMGQIERGED